MGLHERPTEDGITLNMTLLRFDPPETELCEFLITQYNFLCGDFKQHGPIEMMLFSNGIVYAFNGIFAFGTLDNKIFQIIIKGFDETGLTILNTNGISNRAKKLSSTVIGFLTKLNSLAIDTSISEGINIYEWETHKINHMREHIMATKTQEHSKNER